ncbi:MAG: dihydrolipoyl dehydrogenase [Dehalococcoidia bacterium]
MDPFDVAVIGGGWGGYTAAVTAARHGLRTALVERDKLGGTCLHRGCIPTKVLLQTADLLALARRGEEYGVRLSAPDLDYERVRTRKGEVVDQLYRGLQTLVRASKATLIAGDARLEGPDQIAVRIEGGGEERITARTIILATGSKPRALPGLETDGRVVMDSDQILEVERLPGSIIVLGSGAVGVEFASCYNDYGVAVTLVEMLPAITPLEDKDVSNGLARSLSKRGINIFTDARALPETLERTDSGIRIQVEEKNGHRRQLDAEALLVAVGRAPLSEGLGLEKAGVSAERGFVMVDESMRTNVPTIYAVGDLRAPGLQLAHVAAAEGEYAADVIAGAATVPVTFNRLPRTTYCRPQIASIGLTEDEAKQAGKAVKVGRAHLRVNGKALIVGEPEGFVKLVADADRGDILGVHILGTNASELIAEVALANLLDAAVWEVARTVHPHPTLSEAIGEAAQAAERPPLKL